MSSETTQSAGFDEFLAWLEVNKKRLLVILGVAVVIGIGVSFFLWFTKQREVEANNARFKLGMPVPGADKEAAAPSAQALSKLAADYSGTRTAERAWLLAATTLFDGSHYSEALDQFKKFATQYPNSPALAVAAMGKATCLDALNQMDEAIAAYEDIIARYPTQAMQAKLAVGRLYEAKKQPDKALKSYHDVAVAPASAWSEEAKQWQEQLLLRQPQLAALITPKPAPSMTVGTNLALPRPAATNAPVKLGTNTPVKLLSTNPPVRVLTNAPAKPASNAPAAIKK